MYRKCYYLPTIFWLMVHMLEPKIQIVDHMFNSCHLEYELEFFGHLSWKFRLTDLIWKCFINVSTSWIAIAVKWWWCVGDSSCVGWCGGEGTARHWTGSMPPFPHPHLLEMLSWLLVQKIQEANCLQAVVNLPFLPHHHLLWLYVT